MKKNHWRLNLPNASLHLLLGLVAGSQMAASCASTPTPDDSDSNHGSWDRPSRIPRSADVVREGSDRQRWTADLDGVIYIYDPQSDHIDWTGNIKRGQQVMVDPDKDRVYIDDREVSTENIERSHTHQIYFARAGGYDRPDRDNDLPRDASRLTRGTDDLQVSKTSKDGTAYVYDENDRQILYSVNLRRGSSIKFDRSQENVYVNGKRVQSVDVPRGHTLSIYFKEQ